MEKLTNIRSLLEALSRAMNLKMLSFCYQSHFAFISATSIVATQHR